ncbi:4-oxalocrotonate tautomerase family protein (plasmid) [Rhodococcus opacus]|nr:4-oxalocrotonate tautomerase family protein [Rhodococcus opacus]
MSQEQRQLLGSRIVDIVHDAIGSARPHINVVIHEAVPGALVEGGKPVLTDERVG